jgi:TolB protein
MFAPAWSPVDDRLLLGVRNEANTDLVIAEGDSLSTLVSGQSRPISFAWSPDGRQVAYIDRDGPLLVVDAASGEVVARTPVGGVLAFFWSPDGNHVAYVTLSASEPGSFNAYAPDNAKVLAQTQQTPTGIAWSVLDIEDGENRRYGTFVPSDELVYLLTYFDQFAQSHRLWSPDSRQLVYSEVLPDRRRVISLLDTTQAVSVPLVIANGLIGIWSYS